MVKSDSIQVGFDKKIVPYLWIIGWAEKLKMSKIYYGHEVPVVIHKNKGIPLFTF